MSTGTNLIEIKVALSSRSQDEICLRAEVDADGHLNSASLSGVGCREMLDLLREWRPRLTGLLAEVPVPKGTTHSRMLLREVILKAQGRWAFPYREEELCHCRAVATAKVDAAIVGGCHSVRAIRAATSANTSCGTCLSDVESVLNYRLGRT